MKGIGVRQLLDRSALHARSTPDVLDGLEPGGAAGADDGRAVRVREPADLTQTEPDGEVAAAGRLQRAVPSARVDAGRPNLDAVVARVTDDLRGRVEAHRLSVHQGGAKHVRMVVLHPGAGISDLRERGGMALGKTV